MMCKRRTFYFLTILLLEVFISSCATPLIITKRNLILYQIEVNGKSGYIDQKGKVRIDPIYEICDTYDSDCHSTKSLFSADGDEALIVKKDAKFGLISPEGNPITPCIYDKITNSYIGNFVVSKNHKHGYIDSKGNEIVPTAFNSTHFFSKKNILPLKQNGKIGLYNVASKSFKPLDFYSISPFQQGLAAVETNSAKHGVIDTFGILVIDTIYEDMQTFYSSNLLAVKSNGSWNYINRNGEVVIDGKYTHANLFWTDYAIVETNGKFGIIDTLGNYILEPKYAHLNSTGGDIIQINTGYSYGSGKEGLINLKGDTLLPSIYDDVFEYAGFVEVTKDSKVGVIELENGELIIPTIFKEIYFDDVDLTLLRFEDETGSFMGYINRKQKVIWSNNEVLLKSLLNQ
jgi:hypothetical protein